MLVRSSLLGALSLCIACSDTEPGPGNLTFSVGQEDGSLEGIEQFEIERIDSDGSTERLATVSALPEAFELGTSGVHQYRVTGFDGTGNRLVAGRTLTVDLAEIKGQSIPLFLARTDRPCRPDGGFEVSPSEYPTAGLIFGKMMWLLEEASESSLKTDAYSLAYLQQMSPPEGLSTLSCPDSPCQIGSLVTVGLQYALAISPEFALAMDLAQPLIVELEPPDPLTSWDEVVGGRVLPGADEAAVLVGPARMDAPSRFVLGVDAAAAISVLELSTERQGAATLFEPGFGLLVAGGSTEGSGLERLVPGETEMVDLEFPADPVMGAALVIEDDTHVLRVGGMTPEQEPAPTVRIDVSCSDECEYVAVPELDQVLFSAQAFYDEEYGESLVVGEDETGEMKVVRYDGEFSELEIPSRQRRSRASAFELPTRQIVLLGGTDPKSETARTTLSMVAL